MLPVSIDHPWDFLLLDWIPPVVNSIDCTSFGKAHTRVYIRSHGRQCMSEQKPSHEVEEIVTLTEL